MPVIVVKGVVKAGEEAGETGSQQVPGNGRQVRKLGTEAMNGGGVGAGTNPLCVDFLPFPGVDVLLQCLCAATGRTKGQR